MGAPNRREFTQALLRLASGEPDRSGSFDHVFQAAYDELRRIAGNLMRSERRDHTLQPTALVNEAYLRLVDESRLDWQNRAHFFAIASRAMREILVEHARRRQAKKRGGKWDRVPLDDRLGLTASSKVELFDLEEALARLGEIDKRMARIVELRFFGGLTSKEAAHVLEISRETVQKDWRFARMWLSKELALGGDP